MRSRVDGLSLSKSRFFKTLPEDDDMPEAEVSSQSSGTGSNPDEDICAAYGLSGDPYADVRDRMDELARQDRALYAFGQTPNGEVGYHKAPEPEIPFFIAYTVYMSYIVVILIGHIRDILASVFQRGRYVRRGSGYPSDDHSVYAPLLKSWEHFYARRIYHRVQDAFNRPLASNPGANVHVVERVSEDRQKSMKILESLDDLSSDAERRTYTDGKYYVETEEGSPARRCLNLSSYNYLGFADDWQNTCAYDVKRCFQDYPVNTCSSRNDFGTTSVHRELEKTIATFLGKEDAIALSMGFSTNATTIPSLVGEGDLVISDELNHTSIINGVRSSGATVRVFRHNDMRHLNEVLKDAIIIGRPKSRRPWNKIMVVVEGVYSMEGEYCDLRNIVKLCKEYGAYLYLDEAHSIGAMGATGRGITEYTGVDTADVDIMMGTFTKSFGGMGGYIAADKETIAFLRQKCAGSAYHNSISPAVCRQVLTALKVILGEDDTNIGRQKLQSLRDNSNYFRMKLEDMGLQVLGQYDSPIVPVMLYNLSKIAGFSREAFKRGLAVVVVGSPAVPLLLSRVRFCISASHTRKDLDRALVDIEEIADICNLRYADSRLG